MAMARDLLTPQLPVGLGLSSERGSFKVLGRSCRPPASLPALFKLAPTIDPMPIKSENNLGYSLYANAMAFTAHFYKLSPFV